MSARFTRDDRLSAAQVARKLDVHPMTVVRWWRSGLRGHLLRSIKVGGRRFTFENWLEDFLRHVHESESDRSRRRSSELGAATAALLARCKGGSKCQ
ncbi:MAG: DUF1580 domain-containing protein [Planctomycetes bacterium]|nr:DUF1580 domain-containing protein [Planctomycetota bacterium]